MTLNGDEPNGFIKKLVFWSTLKMFNLFLTDKSDYELLN